MAQLEDHIRHLFDVTIEAKIALADTFVQKIAQAAQRLVNCLLNDGKIFLCGNGGSAANCLHFSTAMLNHFEVERPPLPVIMLGSELSTLTAIINDGHSDQIFARQVQALGHENDVLLALSTTGNANSLLSAVSAANDRGIDVIALTGRDGGLLANHLSSEDLELRIANDSPARIREIHLFILHCFCDLIDQSLFGQILG
jgi:D-sedoheptulose 7-phosphate isomerase